MKNEESAHSTQASALVSETKREARRRLIRGGVAGVPIVLTLASTPVLACNCKQPSGFSVSGNLSHKPLTGEGSCTSTAKTPLQIKAILDGLPSSDSSKQASTKKFAVVFPSYNGLDRNTLTLYNSLSNGNELVQLLSAAWMNTFVYGFNATRTEIQNMGNAALSNTGYTVTAGVIWYRADIIIYLKYAMGLPY